ncbi:hypothetical protein KM043_004975 [Ampulex compressa]|nr:hypothetical protein KM043_004975 [Ampulex compressa]
MTLAVPANNVDRSTGSEYKTGAPHVIRPRLLVPKIEKTKLFRDPRVSREEGGARGSRRSLRHRPRRASGPSSSYMDMQGKASDVARVGILKCGALFLSALRVPLAALR